MDYKEIKKKLDEAGVSKNKTAMFHYLTLKYAADFIDDDPLSFCKAVGMKDTFAAEFRKMRSLHLLMKSKNLKV